VHVGFESGSQRVLDAMGKGVTVEQNRRAAEIIRAAGMRVYALMVIGSVAESVESINETIDFLNAVQPDVVASVGGLMLLPGTRDFRQAVREGVVREDYWLGDGTYEFYTKTFSREELALLALAVSRRTKLLGPRFMHPQLMLTHPLTYASIIGPHVPLVRDALRIVRRVLDAARGVWPRSRGQ
jgi:radical SAM superfamily enzyme YgiQ (UPF0313 family)